MFKKILLYTVTGWGLVAATSCKKNDLPFYSGADNIYFADNNTNKTDTAILSFGYALVKTTDSTASIVVKTIGSASAAERPYKVIVLADSTTAIAGTHYDALPQSFSIKPNKVTDTIAVKVHRTRDMQDSTFILTLRLQPNDYFNTYMSSNTAVSAPYSYITYKLRINDIISKPKYWLTGYHGTFSRKKILLMAEVLETTVADISATSVIAEIIYQCRATQLYLNAQKAAGNPVYEDDGSLMSMGASVQ